MVLAAAEAVEAEAKATVAAARAQARAARAKGVAAGMVVVAATGMEKAADVVAKEVTEAEEAAVGGELVAAETVPAKEGGAVKVVSLVGHSSQARAEEVTVEVPRVVVARARAVRARVMAAVVRVVAAVVKVRLVAAMAAVMTVPVVAAMAGVRGAAREVQVVLVMPAVSAALVVGTVACRLARHQYRTRDMSVVAMRFALVCPRVGNRERTHSLPSWRISRYQNMMGRRHRKEGMEKVAGLAEMAVAMAMAMEPVERVVVRARVAVAVVA